MVDAETIARAVLQVGNDNLDLLRQIRANHGDKRLVVQRVADSVHDVRRGRVDTEAEHLFKARRPQRLVVRLRRRIVGQLGDGAVHEIRDKRGAAAVKGEILDPREAVGNHRDGGAVRMRDEEAAGEEEPRSHDSSRADSDAVRCVREICVTSLALPDRLADETAGFGWQVITVGNADAACLQWPT